MSTLITMPGPDYAYVDAHTGDGIKAISDGTVASADPLDLTALAPGQYDVTGTVGTDEIIITEGAEFVLVYQDALDLTESALLELPGGDTITTALDSWGIFRGYAAGVTKCLHWSDSNDYSRQTFENIYIKSGGNITYDPTGNLFDVGRSIYPSPVGAFIRFQDGFGATLSTVKIIRQDGPGAANLQVGSLTDTRNIAFPDTPGFLAVVTIGDDLVRLDGSLLSAQRIFQLPDYPGTFSLIDGTETLTNKDIDGPTNTVGFASMSNATKARLNLAVLM